MHEIARRLRRTWINDLGIHFCFLLGLVCLVGVGIAAYLSAHEYVRLAERTSHAQRVQGQVITLMSKLEATEASYRGYLLTGNQAYLRSLGTLDEAQSSLASIAKLTVDNPEQQARVARLEPLLDQKFRSFEAGLKKRQNRVHNAVEADTHELLGLEIMNKIQSQLDAMGQVEKRLAERRGERARASFEHTCIVIGILALFSTFVALMAWLIWRAQLMSQRFIRGRLTEAQQSAERALKTRTLFLAAVSHELRTPLNSIIGMSEILSETALSPEQQRYVNIFRRAGNTLMNLVNDILDFSRIDASKLQVEKVAFDLNDLVDHCVEMVAFRASQKGLQLGVEISASVPRYFEGDPTRIRQVLFNLLGNAVKFTQRGQIRVCVESNTVNESEALHELQFSVRDTGCGIPENQRHLVFEEFNQLNPSVPRTFGGTGLGLTISRKLVELMGGELNFNSHEGQGSLFYFTLPLKRVQASSLLSAQGFHEVPPLKILVVDDIEDNRLIVGVHLRKFRHELVFAENGAQAVDLYEKGRFDMVLMDIHMPGLDGYEATKRIRAFEQRHQRKPVPIVALTAFAMREEVQKSLEAGCTAHIAKPVIRDALLNIIRSQSEGRPADPQASPPPSSNLVTMERAAFRLLPKFLENRRRDFERLDALVASEDFHQLRSMAHNLKGTCGSYGFFRLSELATSMHAAAGQRDIELIRKINEEMKNYLNRVEIRVEDESADTTSSGEA